MWLCHACKKFVFRGQFSFISCIVVVTRLRVFVEDSGVVNMSSESAGGEGNNKQEQVFTNRYTDRDEDFAKTSTASSHRLVMHQWVNDNAAASQHHAAQHNRHHSDRDHHRGGNVDRRDRRYDRHSGHHHQRHDNWHPSREHHHPHDHHHRPHDHHHHQHDHHQHQQHH
eukprot:scpid107308/ scgid18085/ 